MRCVQDIFPRLWFLGIIQNLVHLCSTNSVFFSNFSDLLVCFFFITQFLSLITLNTTPVWHLHSISITQYFSHYLWVPYLSLIASFFFLPKLTKPSEKKKKKKRKEKKRETQNRPKWKKEEEEENKKKKKKKRKRNLE